MPVSKRVDQYSRSQETDDRADYKIDCPVATTYLRRVHRPSNGLRLSGARKGVRCSRGLGRVANIELTTTLSPPQTVKLDDAENRPDSETEKRKKSDDNTPVTRPPFPVLNPLSRHPGSDRAYRGDAQVKPRDEWVPKALRNDEEHAASHKPDRRNTEKADEPTNRVVTRVFDCSFKHDSPSAA
jgi:hypothetical protein